MGTYAPSTDSGQAFFANLCDQNTEIRPELLRSCYSIAVERLIKKVQPITALHLIKPEF
jgi:hypothetical protein